MSNFDYKKYLAEGRIHLSEDEEQGTMSNIEVYTATFDNDFGTFIDDFASTVGVDNNVEMDQGRISTRPGDFNAWDEFGYEEHWNSIPDGSYFKIEGNTPGMVDYPSLKDYTFVRKGNVIKGELVTLKRDLAEGRIHLKEGKFGNVIQSLTQDISKAQDEGDSKMVSILKSYLPKLKTSEGDAEIESTLNALDTELAREFGESFDIVGSYLAEGIFSSETSYEKEQRKLEDALDRFVKYSIENGDSEDEVLSILEREGRDAIAAHQGGLIDDEDLLEGKLHLNENIEQYIDSEDDISDIRGGKTIAINFSRRMNGGQRKEAVEAYVYNKYGNDVELDWRDGQEVEIHIGNASNDPSPSNNLGVSDELYQNLMDNQA
jgi:hypothetical protein